MGWSLGGFSGGFSNQMGAFNNENTPGGWSYTDKASSGAASSPSTSGNNAGPATVQPAVVQPVDDGLRYPNAVASMSDINGETINQAVIDRVESDYGPLDSGNGQTTEKYEGVRAKISNQLDIARISLGILTKDEQEYQDINSALANQAIKSGASGYLTKSQMFVRNGIPGLFAQQDYINPASEASTIFTDAKKTKNFVAGLADAVSLVTGGLAFGFKNVTLAGVSKVASRFSTLAKAIPAAQYGEVEPDALDIAGAKQPNVTYYGPEVDKLANSFGIIDGKVVKK